MPEANFLRRKALPGKLKATRAPANRFKIRENIVRRPIAISLSWEESFREVVPRSAWGNLPRFTAHQAGGATRKRSGARSIWDAHFVSQSLSDNAQLPPLAILPTNWCRRRSKTLLRPPKVSSFGREVPLTEPEGYFRLSESAVETTRAVGVTLKVRTTDVSGSKDDR